MNRDVNEEILQRIQASESDLTELTFQDGGRSNRIFIHDLTIGARHLEFTCSIIHGFCLLGRHLGQFGPMAPITSSDPGKLKHRDM